MSAEWPNEAMEGLLTRVAEAPLFEHVGDPISDERVMQVSDWNAAVRQLDGNTWVNLGTRILNRLFARAIADRGRDWFNQHWNRSVVALKKQIGRRLSPSLMKVMRGHKLPTTFQYFVIGDVMVACLLLVFEEEASAPWSEWVMHWYQAGHVPCGYTGKLPSERGRDPDRLPRWDARGKLIVY